MFIQSLFNVGFDCSLSIWSGNEVCVVITGDCGVLVTCPSTYRILSSDIVFILLVETISILQLFDGELFIGAQYLCSKYVESSNDTFA